MKKIIAITLVTIAAAAAMAVTLTGCSVKYTFSGASIPPAAKTISIAYFPNNAAMVAPILSSTLTEALQDRFSRQTRLQLVNEMLQRGYRFLPIELGKSYASKYIVENDMVRLPFTALKGVGETAAIALEKATINGQQYISIEELQQASGVSGSIMEKLRDVGALGDLPDTSQVSFFNM